MSRISCRLCLGFALFLGTLFSRAGCGLISAAEGWSRPVEAGPFVCYTYGFSPSSLDNLFKQLAQLQIDLIRRLGIRPTQEQIQLLLFHDKWSYQRYFRQRLPEVPYRRALYVKSDSHGIVMAYRSREFELDVRHESTHALLHAALPLVPLWLDEGLAEYFEVVPERRAFDNPHLGNLRWNLRFGKTPCLEQLEHVRELAKMGRAEYRDSWAWVHFMLHGPAEANDELVRFLADIQAGTPPGLLSRRLKRRMMNPTQAFEEHFRGWKR